MRKKSNNTILSIRLVRPPSFPVAPRPSCVGPIVSLRDDDNYYDDERLIDEIRVVMIARKYISNEVG